MRISLINSKMRIISVLTFFIYIFISIKSLNAADTNDTSDDYITSTAESIDSNTLNGSFFTNAKKYNFKLPASAKLESVAILSVPGVSRPADLLHGYYNVSYYQEDEGDEEEDSDSGYVDEFGMKWNITSLQSGDGALSEAERQATKLKQLYNITNKFLSFTEVSEIVFICMDSSSAVSFTKKLLIEVYPDLGNYITPDYPFTLENYNSSFFNPQGNVKDITEIIETPKIARLMDDFATSKFGFSFLTSCSKMKYYSVSRFQRLESQSQINTVTNFFPDIINNWITQFGDKGDIFYNYKGSKWMYLDEYSLVFNRTLNIQLVNHFLADFEYFGDDPDHIEKLINFIPGQTLANLQTLYDFKKYLTYQVVLYSNLYNYLTVAPFIRFIIEQFNIKILGQKEVASYYYKLNWFTVSSEIIAALYKVFNYDSATNANSSEYLDLPLINYGYTVSFELWSEEKKVDTKTTINYYILMRENYSDQPVFVLKSDFFSKLLNIVMVTPEYTSAERSWFCGVTG